MPSLELFINTYYVIVNEMDHVYLVIGGILYTLLVKSNL